VYSSEFLTLIFAVFSRTHTTLTQCMIHNKLFSIVTRHEIIIFDVDLWNGSNFEVQLKMTFAVIFHFVTTSLSMSETYC